MMFKAGELIRGRRPIYEKTVGDTYNLYSGHCSGSIVCLEKMAAASKILIRTAGGLLCDRNDSNKRGTEPSRASTLMENPQNRNHHSLHSSNRAGYRTRGSRKSHRIILLFLIALLSTLFVALQLRPRPDAVQIDAALRALSNARNVRADVFAPTQFHAAETSLRALIAEWQAQNRRCFLVRDYHRTIELASCVDSLSKISLLSATHEKDSLYFNTIILFQKLRSSLAQFKESFGELPINRDHRDQLTRSELLVSEGCLALKNGEVMLARKRLETAETLLTNVTTEVHSNMQGYFERLPQWTQWAERTIAWSRNNKRTAIVIDKMEHTLSLYQNGNGALKIPVELGMNWIGAKSRNGDLATPEGQYFIRYKKNLSKFHKALEIDYPNAEDRKRLCDARLGRSESSAANLGGNIEIHGGGGKSCNWTDGCVALANSDIDKLYPLVCVGTPVTIVGTVNHELLEHYR